MDNAIDHGLRPRMAKRIRHLIEEAGGEPVGPYRRKKGVWYQFHCERGHERHIPVNSGSLRWLKPCRDCEREDKLEEVRAAAAAQNARCLTTSLQGTKGYVEIECEQGHRSRRTVPAMLRGWPCSECTGRGRRKTPTIESVRQMAAERGGECLSEKVTSTNDRLHWKCGEGHTWRSTYHSVGHEGSWCPKCARASLRVGLEAAQALASRHNGECLSKTCRDTRTVLRWRCSNGHTWRLSLNAQQARDRFCNQCEPPIRKSSVMRNDEDMLEWAKSEAKRRGGKCLSTKYDRKAATLEWECANGHRWEATCSTAVHKDEWCPECPERVSVVNRAEKMLGQAHAIAEERGGHCLSVSYVNNQSPLTWRCGEGHEWEACLANVKQRGSWCPVCSSVRVSVEMLRKIAEAAGGELLSTTYKPSSYRFRWRCRRGHEFRRTSWLAKQVFCGTCEHEEKMRGRATALAERLGGEFRSSGWSGSGADYEWCCAEGHRFIRSYRRLRDYGEWCPECTKETDVTDRLLTAKQEHDGTDLDSK